MTEKQAAESTVQPEHFDPLAEATTVLEAVALSVSEAAGFGRWQAGIDTQRKTINGQWLDYRAKVISPNAPEIQLIESKRAFFAGALALFHLQISGVSDEEEFTETDQHLIENLVNELHAFQKRVAEGLE